MGIIQLEGMEFYAYHGHYKEEQLVGNKFMVDLSFEAKCSAAAESDNLKDAVNYQVAYNLVKKEMLQKSHLLEHIAKRIIDVLYQNLEGISKISVKISKLNPSMGGQVERVSVTLSR